MEISTTSETENLLLLVDLNTDCMTGTTFDKDPDCKVIINNCSHSAVSSAESIPEGDSSKCRVMGVENTWNEKDSFCVPTAADFPIPLPPPPICFDDLPSSGCSVDGVESGTLEGLFSTSDDQNQTDHLIIDDGRDRDVSDANGEAGVCGLRNLGNTCFMSTGVQCLVATPSLIRCLLDKTVLDNDVGYIDSLTAQLAALTNKMWSGHYSSVQPADFKHSLGAHYPQFKDFRQHDCQEFLALLLDGLHEQMNCANSKWSTLVSSNNNFVENNGDNVDSDDCDTVKEKSGCDDSLQHNERLSPKKEFADFNNYKYNNIISNKYCKKEFSDDCNGVNKLITAPSLLSPSSLQNSKIATEIEEFSEKNVFTLSNSNNTNKFNGVCNNNPNDNVCVSVNDKSLASNNSSDVPLGNSDHNHWYNGSCLTGIQDIMKDAKTSNVNVLVTEQENNNEIRFDSDKYPKSENLLRRKETLNFNAFHIYDNNTSNNNNAGKRVKSTVTHYNCVSDFREGLDLKRIKMHRLDYDDFEKDKNQRMEYENTIKSKTLDINLVEKNLRIECERKQRELDGSVHPSGMISPVIDNVAGASGGSCCVSGHLQNGKNHIGDPCSDILLDDEDSSEGRTHWEKHVAANKSIIVDTFQGQFRSTVVCSACKYVSVTYEPFMYLSVPLPHAMERQICVTFITNGRSSPTQYLITLNKRDKISKLKEQLIQLLNSKEIKNSLIVLAEVFDNHVAKILNDNHLVRYVDDINRTIYAFELMPCPSTPLPSSSEKPIEQADSSIDMSVEADSSVSIGDNEIIGGSIQNWNSRDADVYGMMDDDHQMTISKSCTICLEEKESNVQRHFGCDCILCDGCVASSFQHYGGDSLVCPVCRVKLNPITDLVPVENDIPSYPIVRMLLVPIVYRIDILGDGNNNKKTVKLVSHPNVVRLRNNITSQELYKVISDIVPYALPYKILLVDGQGRHCSRCMFNAHCRGCAVNNSEGPLNLTAGDTLAVTFTEPVEEHFVERHSSMSDLRSQQPLTLYDCIQAFSQSEVLDKQNPWYCPKCQKNQCATKTLSVWRCPDYLIVYLKRFVFQDGVSTKLEDKVMFPFHGLNLTTSISYSTMYDLYACVCHIGGVSAGHYTSYTQHPKTEEWHYYNDDIVAKQMPQEEDYSNAYILFYKKRGLASEFSNVNLNLNDGGEGCSSYNTI